MGYLDESQFLGDAPQAPMALPSELAQQLAADIAPAPADGIVVPEGWVRLPGGIIIKKGTLILLGVAIAVALAYWYSKRKKK